MREHDARRSTVVLTPSFHLALSYASALHQDQRRKRFGDGEAVPYVAHLLNTCAIVLQNGGDEEQAIAALLHDAVEDQGGEPQARRIGDLFGERVEFIVRGCSDSVADTTAGLDKAPWRERKLAYIRTLQAHDDDVALISAADKLDNARTTERDVARHGDAFWSVFNAPKEDTIAYYRTLIDVYRTKGERLKPIVDELSAIIERVGAGVPSDVRLRDAADATP